MALTNHGNNDILPMRASANVTALTYTGNPPVYSSGGLVFGTCVVIDTGTGNPVDVKPVSGANQVGVIGIATDYPAVGPGYGCAIQTRGVAKCLAGGVINPGDYVTTDSSARVVTQGGGGNFYIVGQSVGVTTVEAGDYVSILLNITPGKVVEA